MNKAIFKIVVLILLTTMSEHSVHAKTSMDSMSKLYSEATSEQKRLQLCIDAINDKLISRGGSVESVDKIFGTKFMRKLPKKGGSLEAGVVNFGDELKAPSNSFGAGYAGWYLAIYFDWQGSIQNYYLSDLHK